MTIHEQNWGEYTRYLIIHKYGSVFLDIYLEKQESFGGTAYIWGLFVFERDRRKGIGKILLEEAEHWAEFAGHNSVVLDWELKSSPRGILDWYLRSGYAVVGKYREERYTLEKKLK